jgi:hypothetical protein
MQLPYGLLVVALLVYATARRRTEDKRRLRILLSRIGWKELAREFGKTCYYKNR